MRRSLPFIAAGFLCAAAVLLAAERATFILTDGERVSGEVVFHTDARTNIRADKNEFNVKINSGVEMPIPFDHVVLIDFVGGQPRAEELSALPAGGHLLTLRNGQAHPGRLVDFIGGTTIRWSQDGRERDIPITDARRVFLKLDRVREIYAVPAATTPTAQPQPAPTPSRQGSNRSVFSRLTQTTVTVRGAVEWNDTAVTVRKGQNVFFETTGQVFATRDSASPAGPDGRGTPAGRSFPVDAMPMGGLIAKVGPNGAPFPVGSNSNAIVMPADGRLFLGINDTDFDDNSGSFRVVVAR